MTYRLAPKGVTRIADDLAITRDMPEWQEYRAWLKAGNVPEPEVVVKKPKWPSLDAGKQEVWARCKRKRDALEAGGFPYQGKTMDGDPRAAARIALAALSAHAARLAGQPLTIPWTAADGSTVNLGINELIGMPAALAGYANTLHQTAKGFKVQIAAATTLKELDDVLDAIKAWQ